MEANIGGRLSGNFAVGELLGADAVVATEPVAMASFSSVVDRVQ
jgi:hypothetical protein